MIEQSNLAHVNNKDLSLRNSEESKEKERTVRFNINV